MKSKKADKHNKNYQISTGSWLFINTRSVMLFVRLHSQRDLKKLLYRMTSNHYSNKRKSQIDRSLYSQMYARLRGLNVCIETIRIHLVKNSLFRCCPSKKPLVNAKNRNRWMPLLKRWASWNKEEWQKVLLSNGSKSCLLGSDDIKCYIRHPIHKNNLPRYQIPTVKHSGNVMIWSCFGTSGLEPLEKCYAAIHL